MAGGCGCYWGCGTAGNRVVWVLVSLFAVAGVTLAVVGGVLNRDCFSKYQDCMNGSSADKDLWQWSIQDGHLQYEVTAQACAHKYQEQCGLIRNGALALAGLGLLVVIIPILMCYFCCCATRPAGHTHYPAMTAHATAAPIKGYAPGAAPHPTAAPHVYAAAV